MENLTTLTLPTLVQVCQSPREYLDYLDIGALNLMCAGGLPHSENIEIIKQLQWLDQAAEQVGYETRRHLDRFYKSPAQYHTSLGYFCCYHLLQVLQEDFKIRYNPARIVDENFQNPKCINPDFTDSRDLFIHGIIDGPGGTCASMPVLYVAVGRRRGYPLKLVEARGHLFFRWDDPQGHERGVPERFNIEGTGLGIGSYPDAYYETWPEPWSEADKAGGWYLKSLSPTEELAAFLATRGECLADNGRTAEAIQAYEWACSLVPNDLRYRAQLMKYVHRSQEAIRSIEEMLAFQREAQKRAEKEAAFGIQISGTTTPPHGGSCQCLHCKQAPELAEQKQGVPGHLPNCFCVQCQRTKQGNPQGFNGHGPHCDCSSCQQASRRSRSQANSLNPW